MEEGRTITPNMDGQEIHTPWIYPKKRQEIVHRPENWLDGNDHYTLRYVSHHDSPTDRYARGRMFAHPQTQHGCAQTPRLPLFCPQRQPELTERPTAWLGGSEHNCPDEGYYTRKRPQPIALSGGKSVQNSPFLQHSRVNAEPVYHHLHA